jgi:hypothetical protein
MFTIGEQLLAKNRLSKCIEILAKIVLVFLKYKEQKLIFLSENSGYRNTLRYRKHR